MTANRSIRWSRESTFEPINTTDIKNRLPNHRRVRTISEHFRLKIEEYLRTASFKSNLLVLIKKECRFGHMGNGKFDKSAMAIGKNWIVVPNRLNTKLNPYKFVVVTVRPKRPCEQTVIACDAEEPSRCFDKFFLSTYRKQPRYACVNL